MSLDITTTVHDGVATLTLAGEADAAAVGLFQSTLTELTPSAISRLVLDCADLTYMSSAGLRCLVYAHQRLGRGVPIEMNGVSPEVEETVRLTGLDRGVTLRSKEAR
jgi:anti-sigma B factor antagonist